MILEFKVKNFLSFKDEQTLSFEASSDKTLRDYYCVDVTPKTSILKAGIIYGPNASGKTNVLKALDFIKKIACEPKDKDEKTGFIPFLFDEKIKNEPGNFEVSFFIEGMKYIYKFEIDEDIIYNENLTYYPGTKPAIIYSRKYSKEDKKSKINYGSTLKLKASDKAVLEGNTLNNMSLISAISKSNIDFEELVRVYYWFRNFFFPIILPSTDLYYWTSNKINSNQIPTHIILEILKSADLNILGYSIKEHEKELDKDAIETINQISA
ncbi:MAG: ATP-binding protein, partial [Bacteroidetes bacterium]|nr:ATP-binding protein [Bacteroidota bacterium]